ncbi:MAG: hypothetical protein ACE5G3_00765 [Gammaproteobacteria bacterium]
MRFPKEWRDWRMVPDQEYVSGQIFNLKPGMEHAPEHARHAAFHYWLARDPSTTQLRKLAQLSFLDPDTEMGESIRAEILKMGNCDNELRELIADMSDV